MANQGNPLYPQAAPETAWRDTAYIGGRGESDHNLAAGYLYLADVGAEHWQNEVETPRLRSSAVLRIHNDWAVVPILNAYRHSIELALKAGIRDAAACARRDGIHEPDADEGAIDARLSTTHSLGDLAQQLRRWLGCLRPGVGPELPLKTVEILDALHLIDETGQVFRYCTVRSGKGRARKLVPARPDQLSFDFRATASTLSEVAAELLGGLSLMLDAYSDFQSELHSHHAGQYGP